MAQIEAAEQGARAMAELAFQHDSEHLPYGTAWRPVEVYRAAAVADGRMTWLDRRSLIYKQRQLVRLWRLPAVVARA